MVVVVVVVDVGSWWPGSVSVERWERGWKRVEKFFSTNAPDRLARLLCCSLFLFFTYHNHSLHQPFIHPLRLRLERNNPFYWVNLFTIHFCAESLCPRGFYSPTPRLDRENFFSSSFFLFFKLEDIYIFRIRSELFVDTIVLICKSARKVRKIVVSRIAIKVKLSA